MRSRSTTARPVADLSWDRLCTVLRQLCLDPERRSAGAISRTAGNDGDAGGGDEPAPEVARRSLVGAVRQSGTEWLDRAGAQGQSRTETRVRTAAAGQSLVKVEGARLLPFLEADASLTYERISQHGVFAALNPEVAGIKIMYGIINPLELPV